MDFPQLNLSAYTRGRAVPIEDVPDPVFASQLVSQRVL